MSKSVVEEALADEEFRKVLFGDAVDSSELSTDPEEIHAYAMNRGARCKECPLYGLHQGPIRDDIHPDSSAIFIGDGPGVREVKAGLPMVGPTGKAHDRSLSQAGLTRKPGKANRAGLSDNPTRLVSTANAILCRPPGVHDMSTFMTAVSKHRTKDKKQKGKKAQAYKPLSPYDACLPRLERSIKEAGAPVVVPLGQPALESVGAIYGIHVGKLSAAHKKAGTRSLAGVGTQRGYPFPVSCKPSSGHKTKVVLPTYNPAYLLTSAKEMLQVLRVDYRHVRRLIDAGGELTFRPPKEAHIYWYPDFAHNPWMFRSYGATIREWGTNKIHVTIDLRPALPPWLTPISDSSEFLEVFKRFAADTLNQFAATGSKPIVTCDIETSGTDKSSLIRCIGFECNDKVIVVPIVDRRGHHVFEKPIREAVHEILVNLLRSADVKYAGQNFQFDTGMLTEHGYIEHDSPIAKHWIDTRTLHKSTTYSDASHSLAFMASCEFETIGDVELWKGDVDHKSSSEEDDVNGLPTEVHGMLLWIYNAWDCVIQGRTLPSLNRQIQKLRTLPIVRHDLKRLPVARTMNLIGLALDRERASEMHKDLSERARFDLMRLREIVGNSSFNPNSWQQVGKHLFETCQLAPSLDSNGKPWRPGKSKGTGIPALMAIKVRDGARLEQSELAFIKYQIAYKTKMKAISAYLNPMLVKPEDGGFPDHPLDPSLAWLRPDWNPDGTPSGRWTSYPNVQNWPKRGVAKLRSLIVAPPGYLLVINDFEQLELRIGAGLTKDKWLVKAFTEGYDAHTLNVATMLVDTEEQAWEMYRTISMARKLPADSSGNYPRERIDADNVRGSGKSVNFAKQYGADKQKIFDFVSTQIDKATGEQIFEGMSRQAIYTMCDKYDAMHPEILQYQQDMRRMARTKGHVITPDGLRYRFWPDGPTKEMAPVNQPIQGQASKFTDDSMLRILDKYPTDVDRFTGFILQIHDELTHQVPEDDAYKVAEIYDEAFEHEFEGIRIYGDAEICKQVGGKNLRVS